ncbi:hypothetical protein BKA81DRAFT_374138 [Phyllosticta paracitricarpa]
MMAVGSTIGGCASFCKSLRCMMMMAMRPMIRKPILYACCLKNLGSHLRRSDSARRSLVSISSSVGHSPSLSPPLLDNSLGLGLGLRRRLIFFQAPDGREPKTEILRTKRAATNPTIHTSGRENGNLQRPIIDRFPANRRHTPWDTLARRLPVDIIFPS